MKQAYVGNYSGALTGGFSLKYLPEVLGDKILTLLILSSALRIIIISFYYFRIKEVRTVRKISNYELFACMIGIKPVLGIDRKTIN